MTSSLEFGWNAKHFVAGVTACIWRIGNRFHPYVPRQQFRLTAAGDNYESMEDLYCIWAALEFSCSQRSFQAASV
jgi:hypothetical protein